MPTHTHRCVLCGHKWECLGQMGRSGKVKKCEIEKTAKSNRRNNEGGDLVGPFCELCYHVQWAKTYAKARGLRLKIDWPRP